MPKPNTMDDWITNLMDLVFAKIPDHHLLPKFRADVEKSITAKLKEVDRAARISELENLKLETEAVEKPLGKVIFTGVDEVYIEDRLAELDSLKGGDV